MLSPYEKYEEKFLEDIARTFGFCKKHQIVFIQRHLKRNSSLDIPQLANQCKQQLLGESEDNNRNPDHYRIFIDSLSKKIYPTLREKGCDFPNDTTDRWRISQQWLIKSIYPEWVKRSLKPPTLQTMWQKLWKNATPTEKMNPVLVETLGISTLGMWSPKPLQQPTSIKLGSKIKFNITLEQAGYLVLLEHNTEQEIWCLSPSLLASQPYLPVGETLLPQPNPDCPYFEIKGLPGIEEIVAVVTKKKPTLNWLPEINQAPLQLNKLHLHELLEFLQQNQDCPVMRMQYIVTP